ncbi:MAG: GNAT family N-acetyltransferase [Ilumatobacteraceae bacterium]
MTSLSLRVLRTADELAVLPPFEHRIWGGDDAVSVNMLVAVVAEGGVAIGAFDGDDIVGSVFGFPTHDRAVLHSHYMAVDPAWRRQGLGVRLKHEQRAWCLDHGITGMRWTYDPLQLANAHLNLVALGAVGVAYHENHYGTLGGINGDLPSDRITVFWDLAPVAPTATPTVFVDVPPVTADDIASSNEAAMRARLVVRDALQRPLHDGWRLIGVDREARRYALAPPDEPSAVEPSPSTASAS